MRSNAKIEVDQTGEGPAPEQPGPPAREPLSQEIPLSLKSSLVGDDGLSYRDFRRSLTPHWARIWLEISGAYAILIATIGSLVWWSPGGVVAVAAGLVGAVVIGYVIQMLGCFFHEAAHHNLAPDRGTNDAVTNLLMSWIFASSIAGYRRTHFHHHRALGTTMDSETSYFDALGVRFLAQGLLGVKAGRAMRQWRRTGRSLEEAAPAPAERRRLLWIAIGGAVNLGLVVLLLAVLGSAAAAIAWAIGLLVVFPFLAGLRQLLEHRSEDADKSIDYSAVDHGAVNRLFGDGPIASTFGSAGFNRHALHHWEPQLSYTNLAEVEDYLLRTEAAPAIKARRTSYGETFLRLLEL